MRQYALAFWVLNTVGGDGVGSVVFGFGATGTFLPFALIAFCPIAAGGEGVHPAGHEPRLRLLRLRLLLLHCSAQLRPEEEPGHCMEGFLKAANNIYTDHIRWEGFEEEDQWLESQQKWHKMTKVLLARLRITLFFNGFHIYHLQPLFSIKRHPFGWRLLRHRRKQFEKVQLAEGFWVAEDLRKRNMIFSIY